MTSTDTVLPVDSYRDAAVHLRRPFTPAAVKFKIQSTAKNNTLGLVVAYIDSRLVVERLNAVCPHLWHDEYQRVDGGGLLCRLTIDGITRIDVGEALGPKALFSDAFKRAAVKFGVGVSLYAIPQRWVSTENGTAKAIRTGKGDDSLAMTPDGQKHMRDQYAAWLKTHGVQAFGRPLDHGDAHDQEDNHAD